MLRDHRAVARPPALPPSESPQTSPGEDTSATRSPVALAAVIPASESSSARHSERVIGGMAVGLRGSRSTFKSEQIGFGVGFEVLNLIATHQQAERFTDVFLD
jgi:hypothetical protein